jgi:alpha-mannosidase
VTIYRNQPGLFFETEVENNARDHKLSAVFPSRLNPAQVWVDGSFAVLPRGIDLVEAPGWVEDPTPLMHQRAFTDLSEDGRGLAVFNRGLPAVEVTRGPEGATISLVLLRCVGWLSRDDLSNRRVAAGPLAPTPGAQCQGKFRFEYAVFPHAGDWSHVYPFAYQYTVPLLAARADTHEGLELKEMNITRDDPVRVRAIPWPRHGPLLAQVSFISIDPPGLVLSSLHRSRDGLGLIVRFYNPTGQHLQAELRSYRNITEAWRTNLNEERQLPLALHDEHSISLSVKASEIVTVELLIEEPDRTKGRRKTTLVV